MDPIEKAIRGALGKGNPEDMAFRQRIYASAEQALLRSLSARQDMSAADRESRVSRLRAVAASIETEFQPATAPQIQPQSRASGGIEIPAASGQQRPDVGVGGRSNAQARPDSKPSLLRTIPLPRGKKADGDTRPERLRRSRLFNRLVGIFVFVTFAALAVMLGWAVWTSGLFNTAQRSANNPVQTVSEDENGAPLQAGAADDVRNWITVFEPSDISTVEVSEGISAELQGEGKDALLRISSGQGVKTGQATFEVGRGILETLSGKKVVFDIRAHTSDGAIAEIAVNCELAGMGQCQRTRFNLEGQTTDNLLIVQLSDAGPEASGTLTLTPDLGGSGNPVDIQSIRVRVEQ